MRIELQNMVLCNHCWDNNIVTLEMGTQSDRKGWIQPMYVFKRGVKNEILKTGMDLQFNTDLQAMDIQIKNEYTINTDFYTCSVNRTTVSNCANRMAFHCPMVEIISRCAGAPFVPCEFPQLVNSKTQNPKNDLPPKK